MSDAFCSDRKRQTEVVFDHSGGDTVCSECGLVLESHSIDETSEWHIFANESGDNDPVRVGGPTNPLLTDDNLSTVIAKPNGGSSEFLSSSHGRWQNHGSNLDRALILTFNTIATMSDRLGLVATIKISVALLTEEGLRFYPSRVASKAITKTIKQQFVQPWSSWGEISDEQKIVFFERFKAIQAKPPEAFSDDSGVNPGCSSGGDSRRLFSNFLPIAFRVGWFVFVVGSCLLVVSLLVLHFDMYGYQDIWLT
ncbi:hypothetical protein Fmac_015428 [Flemingia macrophylla]|uniref:TFIIB-type domain-containing protein n=1 Tax=Flemingia macrophylla TaxID=520843 RepID=A0ABD1MEI9_9FABA